jgi:hypothetical protein
MECDVMTTQERAIGLSQTEFPGQWKNEEQKSRSINSSHGTLTFYRMWTGKKRSLRHIYIIGTEVQVRSTATAVLLDNLQDLLF